MHVDCEGYHKQCSGLGETPQSSLVVEHTLIFLASQCIGVAHHPRKPGLLRTNV